MQLHTLVKPAAGILVALGLISATYVAYDRWLPGTRPAPSANHDDDHDHASAGEAQRVKLTPQAQANLRLVAKPLKLETFWRTIPAPGTIVDRPAYSDRGVVAPTTGVVTKVHRFPGDTVRPGELLFTLRVLSETLQLTQSELFRTSQEIEINNEKKARLTGLASQGGIAQATVIEIDNQARRLAAASKAYRQELQTRGLTPQQIDDVAAGRFVSEIAVKAPRAIGAETKVRAGDSQTPGSAGLDESALSFEIQELKVELGQQVQAGQTLALVSNHQALFIEGRAFRDETPLVEKAAKEGWPIQVEFMEKPDAGWPRLEQEFFIQYVANTIDPASRTFAFFVPLSNQSRGFQKDGKTFLLWRFRPGQKVRLHIKAEKFEDVFVLPADALVREGPEAFVFRQNGDLFDRKPVRVLYEDRQSVVIANDGSVPPGVHVAQNGATQLNRVLKAQAGSAGGTHVHADGTVHSHR